MAQVRFEHVWKVYGSTEAVRDLSLEVQDGELMALLGPSGCGKTSTLRMIAGLEAISAGEIYFDGNPVGKLRPAERNVAMAFEHYALYPTLSVRENIAFPLVARRLGKPEIRERVQAVLEALEIESIADERPSRLSDGQKQRVGLARALVREPVVFLLDEPLSHLDARQRARMRAFLKRLHRDIKTTMIMVTHDQVEALAVADRVAVMNEGRLEQVSSPAELYERPRTRFVAGFIGEPPMNLLPCSLSAEDGHVCLVGPEFSVRLDETVLLAPNMADHHEREVVLGIRPEDLDMSAPSEGDMCRGRIELVEDLGDEVVVTVRLNDEKLHVVLDPGTPCPGEGYTVGVRPKSSRMCLFSAGTGLSLIP